MTSLLDILKETDLRVGLTEQFHSVASCETLDRKILQKRLLLCLFGLGTNTCLKRISSGTTGENYSDLLTDGSGCQNNINLQGTLLAGLCRQ